MNSGQNIFGRLAHFYLLRHLAALALVAFPSATMRGADSAWLSGRTGMMDWGDVANWVSSVIPGTDMGTTNGDTATFGSNTGATSITIDTGRNLRSLLFNGTDPLGLYTLGSAGANLGEALRLSSGGSLTVAAGTLTATTIHAPLVIEAASPATNGTFTITNNSTTPASAFANDNLYKLNLHGDISGGTTTGSITLNFTGTSGSRGADASANLVFGRISDGDAEGGLAVTVTGAGGGNFGAWRFQNDDNSYTGSTTIGSGTLIFATLADAGVNSALGAGSVIELNAGAQAKYVGGAASSNRTINSSGGILYSSGSGALTLTGAINLVGALTFRGGQNFIVDTVVTGNGGLSRTDSGTVFLNQSNTFNGNLSVQDGAFRFAAIADKGIASPIGMGTTISLGQNSGTTGRIEFTGAGGGSSNRDIVLSNGGEPSSGNGRIDNAVLGQTLSLSGWVRSSSATASHVSSLSLTGVGDGIMSGVIGGTTGSPGTPNEMTLIKNGSGTWGLSNANHYLGPTNISGGTLLALNTTGSATGTGNVSTSGSGVLGGTGFVTATAGGSITIAAGSTLRVGTTHGLLSGAPGPAGTSAGVASFHLGTSANVALTLAGNVQLDLFGGSDGDALGLADRLFLHTTAASVALGGTVVVADASGAHVPWQEGKWQLIDWTGIGTASLTGSLSFTFPSASLRSGYTFVTDDFLSTGEVSIQKTAANQTWTGATNGSWATASNWESGTLPTSGTDVFFAAAPSNLTHAIDGNKDVRNLFFSGEANHVINTGSGGVLYSHGAYLEVLGGSQRLGSAQLRVTSGSVGTYRVVNEGTLRFDNTIMYHRLSGSGNLVLSFSGSGETTLNHVVRRTSAYNVDLRFEGPGTVTFTGSSSTPATTETGTITGTTTIAGGKVRLNNELNLGGEPSLFNPAHLTIDGGTLAAYATFAIDDANRGVTLGAAGGTFEVEGVHVLALGSKVTGAGGLSKTGAGTLVLTGANDYEGLTTVVGGTLRIDGDNGGADGAINVLGGATLGGIGTVGGATSVAAGGTLTAATAGTMGELTFSESLSFAGGSTWLVDLMNGSSSSDLLNVGGALSLGGALSIADIGSFVNGSVYTIATYGSLFGSFSNDIAYDGVLMTGRIDGGGGKYWDIHYNDGGAITLTAIPEPGSLFSLLAMLLAGRWWMRRNAPPCA